MRRIALALALLAGASTAIGEEIRFIGKSVMFSDYVIIRSLLDSRDHKSFVRAARSVGLDQPLLKPGAMTVFAPTDAAFSDMPDAWKAKIVDQPRREAVARLLACHIVTDPRFAGRRLSELVKIGDSLELVTLGGCRLTITRMESRFVVRDAVGHQSTVSDADILQANGMMQIIDGVLIPSS